MPSYVENMVGYLKRRGYTAKYNHAGIYCIKLDNQIVYIGKSTNMLYRVAEHYVGIQTGSETKYRILAEAVRKNHSITFDVLYDASSFGREQIQEEIGNMEGEYIRKYRPILNTQIPKADNWRSYEINKTASTITLSEILQ
jgi:hypothetical protein